MSVYRLSFRILVILCASIVLVAAAVYTADSQEEKATFRDSFAAPEPSVPMYPGTTLTTWRWFAETIDTGLASVCCYGDAALALDQSGHLHISYYDQANSGLKYTFKDTDGWHISTLDEDGGKHSSIALDSGGHPHIVYWQYLSYSQCGVRYTYQDEAGWHVEVVADVNGACSLGGYTRLVLDSDDHPHISYGDYDQRAIIYGYRDSSGWHIETAASSAGKENSLDLDAEERPHIAYYEIYDGDLHYTYRDGTGWHGQEIDSDIDGYENISLKMDVDGYTHISYNSDWSAPSGECLRYAHQDASGWHTESVDCAGFHPGEGSSLSLDTGGIVHISYSGENGLTYAYQEGAGWYTETVDSYSPLDTSLVLENTGQQHIAYTSYTDGVLKHAYYAPAQRQHLPMVIRQVPTPTPTPTATPGPSHTPSPTPEGPVPNPGRWSGPSISFTVTEDGRVGNARACTSCGCFNVSDYTEISSDGMWILTGASTTDLTQSIIGGFVSTTECIGRNVWVKFRNNQLYCYDSRDWTAHP